MIANANTPSRRKANDPLTWRMAAIFIFNVQPGRAARLAAVSYSSTNSTAAAMKWASVLSRIERLLRHVSELVSIGSSYRMASIHWRNGAGSNKSELPKWLEP